MMKKRIPLLLALLVLTGCGGETAPLEPEDLPEDPPAETFSLPETKPAEPISAPAEVTEGRPPAEDYDLAGALEDPWSDESFYTSGDRLALLAELPEKEAAFYTLSYDVEGMHGGLLRWGEDLAEFDWKFNVRMDHPWMDCRDIDGDGEEELILAYVTDWGAKLVTWTLHVVEKTPDGAMIVHTLPESLWREQLPTLLDTARIGDRSFAILGRELVEFDDFGNEYQRQPEVSIAADFGQEGRTGITFGGSFDVWYPGILSTEAWIFADVTYGDGVFTLQNFHLYSYEQ